MATTRDPLDSITRPWERQHANASYRPRHAWGSQRARYENDQHLVVQAVAALAACADNSDTVRLYREMHRRGALTVHPTKSIHAADLIARETVGCAA